jgi:spore germination protein
MDIHVVQPGENIYTIANKYGVRASRLILNNHIDPKEDLVVGQTIVITYPEITHIVEQGDILNDIATTYGISLLQLLSINPHLTGRINIYPGEILTIKYKTLRQIETYGFTYPYIKRDTLLKTLPSLTYLIIFNYKATEEGELVQFYDDTEVVQLAKDYNVIPLMMISNLTPEGVPDIATVYNLFLNQNIQDVFIKNVLSILETKGYYGVDMTFNLVNNTTQAFIEGMIRKMSLRIHENGYLFYTTFNPLIVKINGNIFFDKVDYTNIGEMVDGIVFIQFIWGKNVNPPSPVSSIDILRTYVDYLITMVPPNKIIVGKPLLSYDWPLPFIQGTTIANSLSIDAALDLARSTDAIMIYDDVSKTPYFQYNSIRFSTPIQHIVWTQDARNILALTELVIEYNLAGIAVWNIMLYHEQFWLVVLPQFDIIKRLP